MMESRVRMLLVFAGLPEPAVNHVIRRRDGEWLWRFDMCYPRPKIAVEYDGQQHLDTPRRRQDLLRREQLERDGWLFIVFVSDDVYVDPGRPSNGFRQPCLNVALTARNGNCRRSGYACFPVRAAAAA